MDIKIKPNQRLIVVNNQSIDIKKLEDFILKFWYPLARAYRLKPIVSNGNTLYTFDWQRIFAIASDGSVIIEEFLEQGGFLKTPGETPKALKQIILFN